jgi:hypothetical protein
MKAHISLLLLMSAALFTAACGNSGVENGTDTATTKTKSVASVLSEDNRPTEVFTNMSGGIVHFIPSAGQSNSVGSGSTTVLSATPAKGNLFALQCGQRLTRLSEPVYSALEPNMRESHVSSMGMMFGSFAGSGNGRHAYVFSSHGVGGIHFAALQKGGSSGSYEDIVTSVSLVREAAERAGARVEVPYLAFIHGESDAILKLAPYYGINLRAYAAGLNGDIPRITAQDGPVRMVISQVSGGPESYLSNGTWDYLWMVKLYQWLTSESNGNVVLAGPTYQIPLASGDLQLHFSTEGYRMLGEMMGKAMSYMTKTGKKWIPLSPRSVTTASGKVVISFHVPVGPLRWDESLDAPNRGFELFDEAGPVGLKSVSLENDSVELEPGRVLRGRVRVRYGYLFYGRNPSGGGSLTDSDETESPHGFSLRNYCVLFEMYQSG